MDEDHFIYSRPVVVTEDRLKEALAKQAKQKALKAALDRQVLEAERLKAEVHRAKDRQARTPSDPNLSAPPAPFQPKGSGRVQAVSPAPPAAGPSPPPVGGAGATPSPSPMQPGAVESTRYTFSFREGQGTFEVEGSSARRLQTTLPPSAEGRERAAEGGKPRAPARRAPSSREAGDGESGSRIKRGVGEYQTNSLPLNYGSAAKGAAGKKTPASRERRVSDGGRPPRGASRDRKGGAAGDGSSGSYDTQSLPVELIYKLGQANNNGSAAPSVAKAPLVHHVSSPPQPPVADRLSELHVMHSLLGPLVGAGVPGSPLPVFRENHTTPRGERQSSEDWSSNAPGGRPTISPRGAVGTPKEKTPNGRRPSPRPSARPAGGILPPLHGRSDSDVIEMSAVMDAMTPLRDCGVALHGTPSTNRTPTGSAVPGARRRTSSTPAERAARPSPPPSPRDATAAAEQARKQAEREHAWEQQVKQLKAELRRARAKGGASKGGQKGGEARGTAGNVPRRAETAPDPQPHPPVRGANAAASPLGGAAGTGGALGRNGGTGAGRGNVNSGRPNHVEKMDFGKAHIFTRENFRPITAPEDAGAFFSLPSPPPSLPPLVHGPKPRSREQARTGSVEREVPALEVESSPAANMANTFTSTGTSAEESLKLASLTTRQVTLGLADYGDAEPVPIQFTHLQQFVEAQMITAAQAESLWNFFAVSAEAGSGHYDDADGAHGSGVADDDEVEGAMESTTLEIEVVEERVPVAPGHGAPPPPRGRGSDSGFLVPHSPTQPPTSAVLAPALRRKISQLHSEQEAALLLQQSQHGFHNGRRRPSPSGPPGDRGHYGTLHFEDRTRTSSQTSPTPPRRDAEEGNVGDSGTFDTYSELVLPNGHRGEEED